MIDIHEFIEIGEKDGFTLQTAIHNGCLEEIQIDSLCLEESFRGQYEFVPILRKMFLLYLRRRNASSTEASLSFTMKPAKSDTNKHFEAIRFIEQQMDPSHLFTETTMINIGTLVVIIQAGFREKPDLGF